MQTTNNITAKLKIKINHYYTVKLFIVIQATRVFQHVHPDCLHIHIVWQA